MSQLLELAENALDNKKLGKAEEFLMRASKIDADNVVLLYLKAIIALKRDQTDEALTYLNNIVKQGVLEPIVLLTLADIYQYQLKDIPQAINFLKRYLHLEEDIEVLKRLKKLEQEWEKVRDTSPPAENNE